MRKIRVGLLLVITLCLTNCIQPKLTKRYSKVNPITDDTSKKMDFTVFVLDEPDASTKNNIVNLTDRGQAAFIESLKEKSKDAKSLLSAVGSPIAAPTDASAVIDKTKFKKRIVFSIANQSQNAADRISSATISLKLLGTCPEPPDSAGATFISWDQFANQYGSVDLGKLSFVQNNEIDPDLKLTPGGGKVVSAGASGKFSRSLTEDISLSQRYAVFAGALRPCEARIIQQGVLGIDLTGNQAIDITIKVNADSVIQFLTTPSSLFDDDGNPNTPDKVRLLTQRLIVPIGPQNNGKPAPISASANLDYIIRHVDKGDSTLMEGDDSVTPMKGSISSSSVVLLTADELTVHVWRLVDAQGEILHITDRIGQCNDQSLKLGPLAFKSYDDASTFLSWLDKTSDNAFNIAGRSLCLPKIGPSTPLTRAIERTLHIEIQ